VAGDRAETGVRERAETGVREDVEEELTPKD
jgi:hypothetical protein